ncbi:MAG: biopolymer transporter ExbD [Verrucomicrobiales bacterium]|nr:biopolymer transporter ExbD [Verrucomicrobiales bacterium]MBL69768.1 biopolymer transporter ExbD [Verrucomicrobiales bacterium]
MAVKLRRQALLTEPPASATSDIAFILIIFFLVCASIQEDDGRPQEIPNSDKERQSKNPIRVGLERDHIKLNGEVMAMQVFEKKLATLLDQKVNEAEKTVAVRCGPTVPYGRWMEVTALIEDSGGTITLMRKVQ